VILAQSSKALKLKTGLKYAEHVPTLAPAIQVVDNNTRLAERVKRWTFEGDIRHFLVNFRSFNVFSYCITDI